MKDLTHDQSVQRILGVLPNSAELFVVGGAVRDALLQRNLTDLDLMVRGITLDDLRTCLETLGGVDTSGSTWGVLALTLASQTIDVSLPREEMQRTGDGHYFDVHVTADPHLPVADDLRRRDFTINAMALNVRTGELVDPYHGQEDCRERVLRTIGNPVTRFAQDHSRILRCLRFATQLGFAIEPITWEGLRTVVAQVGQLKVPKRIWEQEFAKAHADLEIFHDWLKKAGIEPIHA